MLIDNHSVVVVERTLEASTERVFDAFTNPNALVKWWGMKESQVIHCEADAVVGGKWRIGTRNQAGYEYWVQGFYREVLRPQRLVFTWIWEPITPSTTEMLVTISMQGDEQQTYLRICHEGLISDRACTLHTQGWSDSLDALTQLILEN
jgi:uncharacterized protein YndB with AHSA1/START domain